MTPSELLASKLRGESYGLTAQEYQDLCVAICALPEEEQPLWDQTVLEYIHDGKPILIVDALAATPQGQEE